MDVLDGKAIIVTGAGRGVGKYIALLAAEEGANVVVNDLGAGVSDQESDTGPAEEVAAEIRAKGGTAFADTLSVADWEQAHPNGSFFVSQPHPVHASNEGDDWTAQAIVETAVPAMSRSKTPPDTSPSSFTWTPV